MKLKRSNPDQYEIYKSVKKTPYTVAPVNSDEHVMIEMAPIQLELSFEVKIKKFKIIKFRNPKITVKLVLTSLVSLYRLKELVYNRKIKEKTLEIYKKVIIAVLTAIEKKIIFSKFY